MPIHNRIDYPVQQIRKWIAKGHTHQWIADHLKKTLDPRVTPKLIYKVCKKHGIQCQRTGPRSGPGHPDWSGGRIERKGYIGIYCPTHPVIVAKNQKREARAHGKYYRKARYYPEHRLVMEQFLGRVLSEHEVVHHRNGDSVDNRIENLQLFPDNAAHLRSTLRGKCPQWTESGKARLQAARRKQGSKSRHAAKQGDEQRHEIRRSA